MDLALPLPRPHDRSWRTAALVMSGVAALELIALVVGGVLLLGRPLAHGRATAEPRSAAARTAKQHAVPQPTILPRARTRVVVLNGNGETGAAATEATAVRARGYRISAVGNAPRAATGPTLVMYRPGFAAEARRLARDAGIGIVSALDGVRPGMLHQAELVIVIGR